MKNFFSELKRRNVYKVAIAYVVAGWALSQGIAQVFPVFDVPNWAIRMIVLLIILGFPVAVVFAWLFEITPEGIKRTEVADAANKHSRGKTWIYVVAIGAIVSIGLFFLGRYTASNSASAVRTEAATVAPNKSIAVLPFDNLSRDPDNAYFCEGVQEEILTRLAKVADLKVISRTSTQHFKSTPDNLPQVAKQLGVAHILEGSVQKAADQVRVNVQLIKAANDSHLWADTFDRKLDDIFAVESEIATTIADKLRAKLTGSEAQAIGSRPTENSVAHELYLRGLYFWNKRDAADLAKALTCFQQAVIQDPNYALAWSGISQAHILLPFYGGAAPVDALPKAKEAANKAILLDPSLGGPHATLGNIYTATFDFPASIREFEKAIELDPNDATTHHWFGDTVLECIGDHDRAIVEHKRALELDPLSLSINVDLGYSYYMAGRYPEGIAQVRKALDLDQSSYFAHYNLGWLLEASGDLPGAITEYEKSVSLDSDPFVLALLGHAQGLNGNRDAALSILHKVTASPRYVSGYSVALIYLGLGDKDHAMDWLEKSVSEQQPDLGTIRFDPLLKPLHGNPRFEALAERIAPIRVISSLVAHPK
jgi:TolB-like protein/Flp pilus assembly protein TadD